MTWKTYTDWMQLEDMGEEQTEDVLADLLVQLVPFWEKVAGREVMLDVLNMCKGFPIKAEQPLLPPPQTESSTPILSARVIAAAKKLPGAESIKDWNMDTLAQLLASTAKIVRDQIAQLPPVSTRSSMSPSETSSPLTSRSSHTQTPTRRLPPIYVGVEVIEFDSSQSSDALPTIPSTKDSPLDLSVDNLTIDSSTEVHQ